ncbi:MAG: NAD(P)/FAD-dependent oxidoreductase [Ruminococcaceae bacterium]|nr:NAD(P)/FAD-dependent oxidoreductase [Oscillospiraceae bacterium]
MAELENKARVVVVGGGAAGMMAAISAAEVGADVTLIERNAQCGKKLKITGKGRCNVTNDCDVREFLQNVPTNPRFLYSALGRFSTEDTKAFFEQAGVPLKVERGRRVFPVSDRAEDIVSAMYKRVRNAGVRVLHSRVRSIETEEGAVTHVLTDTDRIQADAVIVATGGKSYPGTGSDGDGYALAQSVGHTVTPLIPSLVPLTSKSKICPSLQGLSLKNVALKITDVQSGKTVYEDFGEMMFTHFGLTGPMILSASAHLSGIETGKYEAHIDLKPALDEKALDARLLSDFAKYSNKDFINALSDLLPAKLIPVTVGLSGIDARKKVNSITREERTALRTVMKDLRIRIDGFRPIAEAIITKGGVDVREIDPRTMASKLCSGLYFCGEVLDVDAYTGGYNLQIAFSTGFLAGESAAYYSFEKEN